MKAKNLKRHSKRGVTDLTPTLVEASIGQLSFLDSLIETTILQPDEVKEISERLYEFMSEGEAEELTNYLLENQRCNIDGGYNYTQTDIKNKLKQLR